MNDRKPADRAALLRASKLAKADTPARVASVEWDALRAIISDLPVGDQERAWRRLAADLQAWSKKLAATTDSDVHVSHSHVGSGERGEQPRAGAPARARLPRFPITRGNTGRG